MSKSLTRTKTLFSQRKYSNSFINNIRRFKASGFYPFIMKVRIINTKENPVLYTEINTIKDVLLLDNENVWLWADLTPIMLYH